LSFRQSGTGKTTVARLLGGIFKALGILSSGHLVEVDRSGLVAGYVGQTAIKVKEVTEKSLGGILFIDEAYSLASKSEQDYGREAVETLLKMMEDHRDNLVVIAAGYTDEMEEFLNINPGCVPGSTSSFNFKIIPRMTCLGFFPKCVATMAMNTRRLFGQNSRNFEWRIRVAKQGFCQRPYGEKHFRAGRCQPLKPACSSSESLRSRASHVRVG